jgi:hypothetical protein
MPFEHDSSCFNLSPPVRFRFSQRLVSSLQPPHRGDCGEYAQSDELIFEMVDPFSDFRQCVSNAVHSDCRWWWWGGHARLVMWVLLLLVMRVLLLLVLVLITVLNTTGILQCRTTVKTV